MERQTVHLAVYDTMADWEYGYAIAHIQSPEFQKVPGCYEVKTVGATLAPVTTKGGVRIVPDITLAQLVPESSALLILPGADSAATGGIADFAEMAARFLAAEKPVAAICGATAALAQQGLLDKRAHTSNAPEFLAMTGYQGSSRYVDQPAITDGNVITASGVAPIAFAAEIFRILDLYDESTLDAWWQLFAKQDPAGFYALMQDQEQAQEQAQ
ncbi:type 1 glutamine amidotransferase family protein [Photobacterium atrarenae]|uniref:Glutamine amidotransferase n=1 Tax=Photobacterium atrarenae TaxID=865757 RepID=A0ABY5GMZ9_9GAMM|nr:type 1 glutamine amidotransferase family protein [Photobacterium atrarenae]UTV30480.1 glutamine amidotransferase [Photobacterium atrarenae]